MLIQTLIVHFTISSTSMNILGISAYYHDSAAAIIIDGKVIAAAQEERFTRVKHDNSFPLHACKYCIKEANIALEDIHQIVFYEKPFLKFERILETHIKVAPKSLKTFIQTIPLWLKNKFNMRKLIKNEISKIGKYHGSICFSEHHLSHAAFAYYTSKFKDAVILTIDAVGEWTTTSIMLGKNNNLEIIKEQHFPDSIGMLYSAFTYFLGFKVNSDEYKLMGLAPYGDNISNQTNKYIRLIEDNIVNISNDGAIKLNMKYFTYEHSFNMINKESWEDLFGISKRREDETITQEHKNLAYAIQFILEKILSLLCDTIQKYSSNLCISGGTALNCSANGKLLSQSKFEDIYIPFSPGDAGAAIGAALFAYYSETTIERHNNTSPYLGPMYSDDDIKCTLDTSGIEYEHIEDFSTLCIIVANLLADGKIIGWFQDRMEFGPRALGNRSILADPRINDMKDTINKRIKYRESFRPFAPIVISEYKQNYFNLTKESPYMMFTCDVIDRNLPAITHVDNSARVQTVNRDSNPKMFMLLDTFNKRFSCPVLLNTSFNVMGEPIVCSPDDAISTFKKSGLDYCVIGNYILKK